MAKSAGGTLRKLLAYCRAEDWAGYDPYDALNSKVFKALPFLDFRLPRLVLTQALKRSPINIRRIALVPKTQNPKGIALFLAAFVRLSTNELADRGALIALMVDRLIALRSPGTQYWCWGYSFPWQNRTIVVPTGTPNLVCTTFVAGALLDAYEQSHDQRCLSMAASAAEYILNELYFEQGTVAGFSYPLPSLCDNHVHNANFLAAELLCRVYKHTSQEKFVAPALSAASYSVAKQEQDGSWYYGEAPSQHWIDNFHTGYNLCSLHSIAHLIGTTVFDSSIQRGFEFYRAHFFREDGAVRYFHNSLYPIDSHCVSQSIITLLTLKHLDPGNVALAHTVLQWATEHMWDDRGFFYYRILRMCKIRTPYIRWTEAWMLLAISMLLNESEAVAPSPRNELAAIGCSVPAAGLQP